MYSHLSGQWQLSRVAAAPVIPNKTVSPYSLECKVTVNTNVIDPAGYCFLRHGLAPELLFPWQKGTANARPMTLSFNARAINTGGIFCATINDGQTPRYYAGQYNLVGDNAWRHYTVPIPADPQGTINPAGSQPFFEFWMFAGSNFNSGPAGAWSGNNASRACAQVNGASGAGIIQFNSPQLEYGTVESDWEVRTLETEIATSLRYYWQQGPNSSGMQYSYGMAYGAGQTLHYLRTPVPMRAIPTWLGSGASVIYNNGANFTATSCTINNGASDTTLLCLDVNSSGLLPNSPCLWRSTDTVSYAAWSADI